MLFMRSVRVVEPMFSGLSHNGLRATVVMYTVDQYDISRIQLITIERQR
jgi:hypothetical protein